MWHKTMPLLEQLLMDTRQLILIWQIWQSHPKFRETQPMSYNVSACYVAQTAMKNRLEALPRPIIGILSGTNVPVIKGQ
jgi:hypothetical protein